jgi:hypothetical protein
MEINRISRLARQCKQPYEILSGPKSISPVTARTNQSGLDAFGVFAEGVWKKANFHEGKPL